jgi:sialic acid synthase SpsE
VNIGGFKIGANERVLVIAEIGVNHDGSVKRAMELVRAAAEAGADAIKLQVFVGERLMHPSARFADYQVGRTEAADPVAMLKQYELDDTALAGIADEASKLGLLTIATPFSPEDVPRVVAMGAAAIKIASPDIVNCLLLDRAAATGLPMILSTGATERAEIDAAVAEYRERAPLALLHCVSSYPTEAADANLRWIADLSRHRLPVGYSDHATEVIAGALATAAGAVIVEKHLTYDRNAAGPDHSASFDLKQFGEYVRLIRLAEQMRGTPGREVLPCERDVRTVSRQGLVTKRAIRKGERIRLEDLTTQRPGGGVSRGDIEALVGQPSPGEHATGGMIRTATVEASAS